MKNNKGFTLVEIIVTIGLLLLIVTITVPSVISTQNRNKQKNYEKLQETIVSAAENYYQSKLNMGDLSECYISLNDLANKNLIKTPITNPKTNEQLDISNVYIKVTKNDGTIKKVNYEYMEGAFDSSKTCPMSTSIYTDSSGANYPDLAYGMIPVIYNDTDDVWEVADLTTEWYNYDTQMWANAVTVNSDASTCVDANTCIDKWDKYDREYYLNNPGTPISMDDINAMWVWIPRYKYKIASNIGSSSNVTEPPQIDVVFESGTKSTGVDEATYRTGISSGTNANHYTHPSFRDIDNITYDSSTTSRGAWDEEITGFWVGKFETGTSNETCNSSPTTSNCKNVDPIIKPDIISLGYQSMSTQFKTSLKFAGGAFDESTGNVSFAGNNMYGLINVVDTHMMKNTEWGAVAILSQSQYGKTGNGDYTGTNKEIYINNSSKFYTGRSGGTPSKSGTNYGTYAYNDMTCGTASAICTGEKVAYKGTGASTTGTIYGIYDMNGGKGEYVMGNWSGNLSSSGFSVFPITKYYDLYKGTSSDTTTIEKSILGDATWETQKWYYDSAGSYVAGTTYSWFSRGGNYSSTSSSGIFHFGRYNGKDSYASYTFHTVLIP